MKLLLFCTVVSLFLYQTDALINVNLDPLDLDRVGDLFENIMFNNHYQALMQPPSRVIHPLRKKVAYGTIQLLGVMLTIVSSNLLTTKLQPYVGESEAEIIVHVKSLPTVQCVRKNNNKYKKYNKNSNNLKNFYWQAIQTT